MNFFDDCIAAQASARGSGTCGILRLSGEGLLDLMERFFVPKDSILFDALPQESSAILEGTALPWPREYPSLTVPCTLYYWGRNHGFTKEPSIELHLPGSQPVLDALLRALLSDGRIRLARPGEFTMRAFLAGRIDLTQAEAILGIIDATDDHALQIALDQLAGGLGKPLVLLRERLLNSLSLLEAELDFSEEDIEFLPRAELAAELEKDCEQIQAIQARLLARSGSEGEPRVVLLGAPNSGKSSLFNTMIQNEVSKGSSSQSPPKAIVSSIAGTTRDYLEHRFCTNGFFWILVDTAGFDPSCVCEKPSLGPEEKSWLFSQKVGENADLFLYCQEQGGPDISHFNRIYPPDRTLFLHTKIDLEKSENVILNEKELRVSSKTGAGIDEIFKQILTCLNSNSEAELVPSTALRCRESLLRAGSAILRARSLIDGLGDDVLLAAELRSALDALGLIVGAIHTDDILDRIFSRFCIGK